MGWTKQQLVRAAFEELALKGYVFSLSPDNLQTALTRLDSMIATWNKKGIALAYPLPSSQDSSSLAQDSNLPIWANEPVYLNLAIRLCGAFGKTAPATTQQGAADAYQALLLDAARPPQMQYPSTLPQGAGNKPWRRGDNPNMPAPTEPLTDGNGNALDFN